MSSIVIALSAFALLAFAMPASAQTSWRHEARVEEASAHRARRAASISLADLRDVARACELAFSGADREQRCVQAVVRARVRYSAAALVEVCARSFSGEDNEMTCLETALQSRTDLSESVAACERAFSGDRNALDCLERVARSGIDVAAIRACESSFSGDANALSCLAALRCLGGFS
jgi:hypothetical protein